MSALAPRDGRRPGEMQRPVRCSGRSDAAAPPLACCSFSPTLRHFTTPALFSKGYAGRERDLRSERGAGARGSKHGAASC